MTGRVLSVTRGKGANALRQFAWRLRRYKGKIMDLPSRKIRVSI